MKHEIYSNLSITDDFSIFEFLSVGPKGIIPKRIEFMPTEHLNAYSLAFGDINEKGEINDYSISNNGDRNKILATIYHTIEIHLNRYPNRIIYFTGSTEERTRLYRMVINNNIQEFELKYDILVEQEHSFVPFKPNIEAIGFLIKKKKV